MSIMYSIRTSIVGSVRKWRAEVRVPHCRKPQAYGLRLRQPQTPGIVQTASRDAKRHQFRLILTGAAKASFCRATGVLACSCTGSLPVYVPPSQPTCLWAGRNTARPYACLTTNTRDLNCPRVRASCATRV